MYDTTTALMQTLASHVGTHEFVADHLVMVARDVRDFGDEGSARTLTEQALTHRVQALMLGARLGALVEMYGALHLDGRIN